ncbi:E3 ubiquitin-protein ligase MARCHF3-like [Atheta coriaria]|uniref:E3 ubiquitin-protein ligase MARCHF3-like n=1 Tax=Dalotia coriaria TaxID=877792 RepID=UPI0031F37C8C
MSSDKQTISRAPTEPPRAATPGSGCAEESSVNLAANASKVITGHASSASRMQSTNLVTIGSMVCRICQTNSGQELLISPCHCKGSMAYVHLSCLERWLNQASRCYCELCMYQFNAVQTKRYGLCQGLKMWMRHPRNRAHIQSDLLIALLLTAITVGLVIVCLLGLQYFVIEAQRIGVTKLWTEIILSVFICVVLLGYVVTIYLLVRDQVVPWYTWWRQTVDVRLLLTPSVAKGMRRQLSKETAL